MGRVLMLSAVLLSGCYYDMHAESCRKGEEMCATFGGLKAADETRLNGGGYRIDATCVNGTRVSAVAK